MSPRSSKPQPAAFTLIELLIVVAIIAILAAIAVPNFLEAQMRAKIGRCKADMRSIATALESYAVDNNGKYPCLNGYVGYHITNLINRGGIYNAFCLSTPIAYLTTTALRDPFVKSQDYDVYGDVYGQKGGYGNGGNASFSFNYVNVPLYRKMANLKDDSRPRWFLISYGPDFGKGPNPFTNGNATLNDFGMGSWPQDPGHTFDAWQYDPSNGTTSKGDILRHP
jgi:prepilin-type N-terminal cleavage/methylation domain-containing protein